MTVSHGATENARARTCAYVTNAGHPETAGGQRLTISAGAVPYRRRMPV
ncbi:uncharacterized protein SOCE26_035160 [Sorangium cellulosum]|uniref:Uncharacterized protein n=1 Tax=Sorangium cellulosum TaxID=56 RepID=A0A2L0ES22_SORCE|nr:uncharacterized protein SOCE26_035160 [Sorangium cellulosum]